MKILTPSYLFTVCFVLALLSDVLPFPSIVKNILQLNKNSFQVISSKVIADSEKQYLLLANSFNIFKQSVKLLALIILLIACCFLLFLLSGFFRPLGYMVLLNYLISAGGLVVSTVAFISYFLLKKLYVKIRL
jgi:hypothetical protein